MATSETADGSAPSAADRGRVVGREHEEVPGGSPMLLVDDSVQLAFDRYTSLLARVLDIPVALLSLVRDGRQYLVSHAGLDAAEGTVPTCELDESFCRYVVEGSAPYSTDDAHADPLAVTAIPGLVVGAYTGAPIIGPTGSVIGTLCAVDTAPRRWSADDLAVLDDLAHAAGAQLALRMHDMQLKDDALLLSHDLRNGLTALRLEVAELEETLQEDGRRQSLARLAALLEQQSELARRPAGVRRDTGNGDHELRALLHLVRRRTVAVADAAGRQVVIQGVPDLVVRTDARELCRLLQEMVLVLLHHGRGPVAISVVATQEAVRFHVVDEGDGLPREVVRSLTDRRDHVAADHGPLGASLAEQASRSLGGRLVLPVGERSALDLVIPA